MTGVPGSDSTLDVGEVGFARMLSGNDFRFGLVEPTSLGLFQDAFVVFIVLAVAASDLLLGIERLGRNDHPRHVRIPPIVIATIAAS